MTWHLLRIVLTLILILILIRRKVGVGPTLFICSVFLALVYWMPLSDLWPAIVEGVIGPTTGYRTPYILAAVLMVLCLGTAMGEMGFLKKMVRGIEAIFGDPRWVIGGLPAMIGLLPMPGGALFTAPMVNETAEPLGLSAERKTFLNHHWRHIFEYTWPLYPGLIVLAPLVDVPIRTLAIYNIPLTIAAIAGGIIFGLAWVRPPKGVRHRTGGLLEILDALWPIIFIIALVMLFNLDLLICLFLLLLMLLSRIKPWFGFGFALLVNAVFRFTFPPEVGTINSAILIGNAVVAAVLVSFILWKPLYPKNEFLPFLKRAIKPYMISMVFGIMVFSSVIQMSGAADGAAADIEMIGLPPIFIICLLPALLGYLTGITHSFVAGSFPILIPFFPDGPEKLPLISLAYACGFIGVLISPVHFCLILTVEYFKSDLMSVVKLLLPPCALVFIVALLRYLL
jgi:hypothetical protein